MRIAEILAAGSGLIGQRINVEGYFTMVGECIYIVDSIEQRDDFRSALKVHQEGLQDVVMTKVPPSGGSKYYYLDGAEIGGTLTASTDAKFPLALKDVDSLVIETSGHRIPVIP